MSTERPPIEEMTLRQLRRIASELGISRYSRMRKDQLLSSIQEIQRSRFAASSPRSLEAQAEVEAAKFDVGLDIEPIEQVAELAALAVVDETLPDLPDGYGETRIVLLPRDPQWAYAYWDIPNSRKEELRQQGGVRLALRFYDVTDINIEAQRPHSLQQYECDELAREWYLPIPVSDRDYMVEIGYVAFDGRWLMLARSTPVRIPPVYPSDWIDDQFITVVWEEELRGKTVKELPQPARQFAGVAIAANRSPVSDRVFEIAQSAEAQRLAGSVYSSTQQAPEDTISSYVFPSGVGKWAVPTASGMGMSGAGMISGAGYSASGVGMSGAGMYTTSGMGMSGVGMISSGAYTASGVGMSGAGMYTTSGMGMSGVGMYTMSGMGMSGAGLLPEMRPRQFWLIADAELIVYGATEPDATVTIGGRPIQLSPDGTFRIQMSFQDGMIHFPIMAVAADGEQTRSVHLEFSRTTPERNTNTKEEAIVEWLS